MKFSLLFLLLLSACSKSTILYDSNNRPYSCSLDKDSVSFEVYERSCNYLIPPVYVYPEQNDSGDIVL